MPLYDVHAHLADSRLRDGLEALLEESFGNGVRGILVNAARTSEWDQVVRLAQRPRLYGALGIHPFFLEDWTDSACPRLEQMLTANPRIRAVGEIGLDFYHGRENADRQREIFASQLCCAVRCRRPVIVHNRRSWSDFFAVLKSIEAPGLRGVCHHFSGSREVARAALDRGFYLSFCGPLTYPNARRLKEAARYAPLERLLTETDTPDLPAEPVRGGPSRPHHVHWILEELARLKGRPVEDIALAVERNFKRLLDLP